MNYQQEIEKIKLIQRNIKSNLGEIRNLNKKLNTCYNFINGIMNRIHNNFLIGILNQYEYNSQMDILEKELNNFRKIPRPFKFRDKLTHEIKNINHILKNINSNIFEIAKRTGGSCIFDILENYTGHCIKKILMTLSKNDKNLLYFINNVFVPLNITEYDLLNIVDGNNKSLVLSNSKNTKKQYDIENILSKYGVKCFKMYKVKKSYIEELQGARLYIPIKIGKFNNELVFDGYFCEDPLNLSRVGGLLEIKTNQLKNNIKILDINEHFKNAYIQQISLRDFVIYDINYHVQECSNAYKKLNELKKQTISSLVKDFLVADISKQRYILTLFLLMKDDVDTQYIAYLMYDMISNESYLLKPQPLAEQVFKGLHYSIQKLFKVAIKKINKNINKLLNFNEEEISYEKRIMLMKTSDYVKSKAMEKFKEYSKSNEGSSKCFQYIEGILKIPFGIYRKEKILCCLDNYKDNISLFIKSFIIDCNKFYNVNDVNIKYNLDLCQEYNKKKSLTSQDIDNFINMFNYNMFCEGDSNIEIDNVIKYFKKLKKGKLVQIVKLINEDLSKLGVNSNIDESLKKKDLLEEINNFILNPQYLDITQKYISYIDNDRNSNISNECISDLNNKFFNLNSSWFNYKNDYKNYLENTNKILDDAVYHQIEAKTQIKRIIAQWINGEMKGYCFGFEGPPGTGKTSLAKKGISKCLKDENGSDRPFSFIALGGSSNGSTLEGHSYTYVGSTWGRIVDILMETKCMNPIIYIDELDKVSKTENGKDIIGILTHLTDSTQNDEFCDKYFSGIKLDLSKVLFIFSYNDYNLLDPILADRIHRVKFTKLNKYEKIHIINNYILPELLKTVGFNKGDIIFSKKVLEYIISTYTLEAGVRKVKERVFEIIREINLRYLLGNNNINIPCEVDIDLVEEIFHNKSKITTKKIAPKSQVGLVNGLYATSSGIGGLTIIESFKTPTDSKLSLELTGQQGDVMKESMKVSKTVAWNIIPDDIKKKIYKEMEDNGNFGIHLHCPEGATPKDGPSAGGAITLSIISLLTGIKVKNTVALTGEIDLNGSIHEIGGLESKIEGGKIAGVKKILYPKSNQKDLDLILEKGNIIDNTIEVIPVENIYQIMELCLEKNNVTFNNYS